MPSCPAFLAVMPACFRSPADVLRDSSVNVIVIDEMSMLTTDVLSNVLNRLMQIHQCKSVAKLLQKVSPTPSACSCSNLLPGPASPAPFLGTETCPRSGAHGVGRRSRSASARLRARDGWPGSRKRSREDSDSEDEKEPGQCELSEKCHLAFSTYWPVMTKVQLSCQPRFSDPGYAQFLNLIRGKAPTQAELQHYLSEREGMRHVSRAEAMP